MVANVVAYLIIFAAISRNVASDPDTLQDLCVAAPSSGIINAAFVQKRESISPLIYFLDIIVYILLYHLIKVTIDISSN